MAVQTAIISTDNVAYLSLGVSILSLIISLSWLWLRKQFHNETVRLTKQIHKEQLKNKRMEMRQNVLRKLCGYSYRLSLAKAIDGEPFPTLNEALIVFNDCPEVKTYLRKMVDEMNIPDRFSQNLRAVINEMAKHSDVSLVIEDYQLLSSPFRPDLERDLNQKNTS
ncbi:MAG: hypothetical protein OXF62_07380 [Caldilineaceae bacterium]|nr:hypothetical protein [Caldilineaceae bacterium]